MRTYMILRHDDMDDFEKIVNIYYDLGYVVCGGPFVTVNDGVTLFNQAVVKKDCSNA